MLNNIVIKENPIIGQSISELELFAISLGEKSFRGRQLFDWITVLDALVPVRLTAP